MFFTIPSNIPADAASYWARQFQISSALTAKTLYSMAKLVDLNFHTVRDVWENSTTASQTVLSSENATVPQQAQVAMDAARAYGREVASLACEMRMEYAQQLQGNIATASAQVDARLDELARRVPEAAGGVINVLRTTLGNAQRGYDQVMMTSEQAAQAVVDILDVRAPLFATQAASTDTRSTTH